MSSKGIKSALKKTLQELRNKNVYAFLDAKGKLEYDILFYYKIIKDSYHMIIAFSVLMIICIPFIFETLWTWAIFSLLGFFCIHLFALIKTCKDEILVLRSKLRDQNLRTAENCSNVVELLNILK